MMMPHNALCHRIFKNSTIDLSVVEKSFENSSRTNESSEKRCLTQIMRAPKGGREGGPRRVVNKRKFPPVSRLPCWRRTITCLNKILGVGWMLRRERERERASHTWETKRRLRCKLRAVCDMLGEFWAHIAFFGFRTWDAFNL